ncbi:FUSC family protein [Aldersonia sp. NBC_00410]|uniref:FUSC family protein n=1 Tax=Aldersonia sp. NBC_00410 TaxID=2975954 RepID=UPI002256BDAC|nr:FUSC family protein [Aldersonia sp. NBC_00410]MCX5042869.1 FUSC family protein [Aldersonia sp. NBC_00410]
MPVATLVDSPSPAARRGRALAHAVSPQVWRQALSVTRPAGVVGPATRVGLAVAVILIGAGLFDMTELAGFAALGAVASAFGRSQVHRERAVKVAFAGFALLLVAFFGGLLGAVGTTAAVLIVVLAVLVGVCAIVLNAFGVAGPGAVVMSFAAAAAAGYAHDWSDLVTVTVATAIGAVIGWLCAMSTVVVGLSRDAHSADSTASMFLRTGLRRLRSRSLYVAAARIAIAATVAGWVALGVGFEHPLWASMGAIAALQGVAYEHTVRRGIQRLLGNVVGAVIAAGLIALSLGYWQAAVLIVLLQITAELTVMSNYAITSAAIAPMSLLIIGLVSPVDAGDALARAGDTLIGVVIGVVIAALTLDRTDRTHLTVARGHIAQATNCAA